MKRFFLLVTLFSSATMVAQTSQALPDTLVELAKLLPSLVHSKQFQLGPFSDAVDMTLQKDPTSAASALPMLSRDLQDPDPDVQFDTLVVLGTVAAQRQIANSFTPLMPQFAAAITYGSQYSQAAAIYLVSELGKETSDSVVVSIENLLRSRPSDKLTLLAAQALMMTRPTEAAAQTAVIAVINDPGRSIELRLQVLHVSSVPGVGSQMVNNVVHIVNTSGDKDLRDAGIAAAEQIGPSALTPIAERLNSIAEDPSESLSTHRLVHQALSPSASE